MFSYCEILDPYDKSVKSLQCFFHKFPFQMVIFCNKIKLETINVIKLVKNCGISLLFSPRVLSSERVVKN